MGGNVSENVSSRLTSAETYFTIVIEGGLIALSTGDISSGGLKDISSYTGSEMYSFTVRYRSSIRAGVISPPIDSFLLSMLSSKKMSWLSLSELLRLASPKWCLGLSPTTTSQLFSTIGKVTSFLSSTVIWL